jgi:hypothetical protein
LQVAEDGDGLFVNARSLADGGYSLRMLGWGAVMSIPALTRRSTISGFELAGPIVQTIFALRFFGDIKFLSVGALNFS